MSFAQCFGWLSFCIVMNRSATPCPQGYAAGICPDGMACIADTPCGDAEWLAQLEAERQQLLNESDGNGGATKNQFAGDASKRYCGYGWDDVVQNCL